MLELEVKIWKAWSMWKHWSQPWSQMRLSNDTMDREKNREKQGNSETQWARTALSWAGEKVEKREKQVKRGRKKVPESRAKLQGKYKRAVGPLYHMWSEVLILGLCLKVKLLRAHRTSGQAMREQRAARIDTALFDISPNVRFLCTGITKSVSQVLWAHFH